MEKIWSILKYFHLLLCTLVLFMHPNTYGCLLERNPVSPRNFLFTAVPSINATLGEKLELKCSVDGRNSTSILESINVYSRGLGELNVSCSMIKNKSGECRYTIQKVQLRHRGSYDCIKIYKDQKCFSKTLQLSVSQRRTLTPLTEQSTAESIKRASSDQVSTSELFVLSTLIFGSDRAGSTTPTSRATWTTIHLNNSIIICVSFILWLLNEN